MNPPKPLVKCKCGITYEGKQCPGCGTKNPNKTTTINKANLSKQMLDKAKLQAGLEVKDGS